jgi:glycine cleavage system H protein
MNVPEDLKYTKGHEWVRITENRATVGITDFAQSELGDIVFIELPIPGSRFAVGDSLAVLESIKTVANIYSPVVGTVIKINEGLRNDPSPVNTDPYGEAWVAVFELADGEEIPGLMTADEYRQLITE